MCVELQCADCICVASNVKMQLGRRDARCSFCGGARTSRGNPRAVILFNCGERRGSALQIDRPSRSPLTRRVHTHSHDPHFSSVHAASTMGVLSSTYYSVRTHTPCVPVTNLWPKEKLSSAGTQLSVARSVQSKRACIVLLVAGRGRTARHPTGSPACK